MLIAPVLLAAALAGVYLVWEPPSTDLAAQVFRADLFADHGFLVWSNDWYAGHYLPGYSLLYPPLGAALGPRLVGAIACVTAAALFAALASYAYGDGARLGSLWFAVGTASVLLSGRVTFALGIAVGLAAILALQRERPVLTPVLAAAASAASPVAGLFLGLVGIAAALAGHRRSGLIMAAAALGALAIIGLAFPTPGVEPFVFTAFVTIPVIAALALWLLPAGERELRWGFALYALLALLLFVFHTPIGGNLGRLGALFAGPIFAVVLWPRSRWALLLIGVPLLYWQWVAGVRDVTDALGDPATQRSYYEPLTAELERVTSGEPVRIEIPPTQNRWEAAYVAPEFPLARGWLRQQESDDFGLFRNANLTPAAYRRWLDDRAVSYVAVSDSDLDYLADDEAALVTGGLPYLKEIWSNDDWRLYAVRHPTPLVEPAGARLTDLGVDSFTLAGKPGSYLVRLHYTRFWQVEGGEAACVSRDGDWTRVELIQHEARIEAPFSIRGLVDGAREDPCSESD
jgi:hypothetical protein